MSVPPGEPPQGRPWLCDCGQRRGTIITVNGKSALIVDGILIVGSAFVPHDCAEGGKAWGYTPGSIPKFLNDYAEAIGRLYAELRAPLTTDNTPANNSG